jgi:hypothetical protein
MIFYDFINIEFCDVTIFLKALFSVSFNGVTSEFLIILYLPVEDFSSLSYAAHASH